MIQEQTIVRMADNSGGKWGQCIKVLGGSRKRIARVGDRIVVVVKSVRPGVGGEGSKAKVKRGGIYHAVVVRTRPDFGENAVVLLNSKKDPMGTRGVGPMSAGLLRKGWGRVASLAPLLV
uniref:50S ribosomal protein L14 n=1 Tax=Hemiarma marina TaxID=1848298 RepID=A0A679EK71_9CRYP|nr:50S ribosomal protein L14 [Hemiarma marina]